MGLVAWRQAHTSERRGDINALPTRRAPLGLTPKLRDADAHGKFEIKDDGVCLPGTRGTLDYVDDEELVDVAHAARSRSVALYWRQSSETVRPPTRR